MRPSNKNVGNYRPKDGEQNGSRVYQLMLNSMQVLPVANISDIVLEHGIVKAVPCSKNKRKATEDGGVPQQRKKRSNGDGPSSNKPTRKSKRANNPSKDDIPKADMPMELL